MQWQPMETAPKDRAILGLRADNGLPDTVEWYDDKIFGLHVHWGWKSSTYSYGTDQYGNELMVDIQITHWMELPDQP